MNNSLRGLAIVALTLLALPASTLAQDATPVGGTGTVTYNVTIENLTNGQPFSPPVAATHLEGTTVFEVGQPASDELAAIAQDGQPMPMFELLQGAEGVTDAVNVGRPLAPAGQTVMIEDTEVTDSASFEITANAGDLFSIATMLICTNDGFLGLGGVELPTSGSAEFDLTGYDAGREDNTEMSADLVDPCTALGPEALPGDPNGNIDDGVATDPIAMIAEHQGIEGTGDLSVEQHGWDGPVARVTIEVVNAEDGTPTASPAAASLVTSR